MKTMTTIAAAALLSTGILFAEPAKNSRENPAQCPGMKERDGQKAMGRRGPGMMKNGPQGDIGRRDPGMMKRGPQRGKSFMSYLPGAADLYPEEYAKAEALKKTDPQEAKKQMGELRKKVMEQRMKDAKPLQDAIRAYRETKDEAKLEEVKTLFGKQIDSAAENAKKKLDKSKQELDSLKKLKLSADKAALIEKIYEQDIAETENFISSDRGKMTDKFIEQIKNGPNRRGMKRADGKDAGAPARKKAE